MLSIVLIRLDNQLVILIFLLHVTDQGLLFFDRLFQFLNSGIPTLIGGLISHDMLPQVIDDDLLAARLILGRAQLPGLAADARVQVVAGQNQDSNDPNPKQENDECADGAIQHVVARKVGNVRVKGYRAKNEERSREDGSWTKNDKLAEFLAAGPRALEFLTVVLVEPHIAKIIQQSDTETQGKDTDHPSQYDE